MAYKQDTEYPMTHEQLGAYLLVSRGRAQQIVQTAIHRLRHPMFSKSFEFVTFSREKLLENYFRIFENEERERASFIEAEEAMTKARILAWDSCPIDELGLLVQTYNKLRQNGIDTIGHIAKLGKSGLKEIKGFKRSDKRMQEVEDKLAAILPSDNPFWEKYNR